MDASPLENQLCSWLPDISGPREQGPFGTESERVCALACCIHLELLGGANSQNTPEGSSEGLWLDFISQHVDVFLTRPHSRR